MRNKSVSSPLIPDHLSSCPASPNDKLWSVSQINSFLYKMVFITATENKPEQHIFMKYKYIKKNIAIKQKLLYNIEEYKQKKVKIYEWI